MARDRDAPFAFTYPSSSSSSSSSSPVTFSDQLDSYLNDRRIGSASWSFQNEGLFGSASDTANIDAEFGFSRPEFRKSQLVGTVEFYQRHLFLCYKKPKAWPPRVETADFDRLPRLLYAALMARKGDIKKETRFTICEGQDGTETSNGDVLIFPDMVRYRRLTHFDVEIFVEEVLVKEGEWLPGIPEPLNSSYVFVCSHGSRDRRCGVCGPALISRFKEDIEAHGLQSKVSVSPCSHIGGRNYAGNVIIYGSSINGKVTGHWYGYVTPDDIPSLLRQHIVKGEILYWLWRGQMGLTEEEQKKSQEQRLQMNGDANVPNGKKESISTSTPELSIDPCRSPDAASSSCQQNGDAKCCQDPLSMGKTINSDNIETLAKHTAEKMSNGNILSGLNSGKGGMHKVHSVLPCLDSWEKEDTYAALAVVCASASVVIAYSCYKLLR